MSDFRGRSGHNLHGLCSVNSRNRMSISPTVLRFLFLALMSIIQKTRPMAIPISANVGFAESVSPEIVLENCDGLNSVLDCGIELYTCNRPLRVV